MTNKTEADAHVRVVQAQIGSHVDATDTFLVALRAKLYGWIATIDAELARRAAKIPAYEPDEDLHADG